MSRYKEKHIRKDSWVKELLKTYNPELLASLVEKRIKSSSTTGPYVIAQENSIDIITAYATGDGPDDFKDKIEPAVGLLLYKAIHGQMEASNDFLRHVFMIIRGARLTACHTLLANWINKNAQYLVSKKSDKLMAMYEALYAFSKIQNKDAAIEDYWINIWREGQSYFWYVAFYGLKAQNPETACKELPLLASRRILNKMDKITYLIRGMWEDPSSRPLLLKTIKKGLDENTGWAGLILNTLFDKMEEKQKNEVMESLKELNV